MKFIPMFLVGHSAIGSDKEVVEYINESLALIPNVGEVSQDQCPTRIHLLSKSIFIKHYELKLVQTFGGPPVKIKKYMLDRPYPIFNSTDEAALFFTDFIKKNFNSATVEFCAILSEEKGEITFKKFFRGTPGSCPTGNEEFENPVGGVHTHPGGDHGGHSDLSLSIQTPSYSDYAVAVDRDYPQYMAAPAGQVLKYTKDDIECRGSSAYQLIKLNFEELRKPNKKASKDYAIGNSFQVVEPQDKAYLKWLCPKLAN